MHAAGTACDPLSTGYPQGDVCGAVAPCQSAYSRLENGETIRWSVRAREGAAKLLGATVEKIAADLDGENVSVDTLTELGIWLQRIASDTAANRAMLNELIATRRSRHP